MMRIALDADQRARRDATRVLLAAECTSADVRAAWASDSGMSRVRWRRLAELGLTSVLVPSHLGGLGGTELDLVPLLEETGYVALPEPIAPAAVVASLLVEASPIDAARWLPSISSGDTVAAVGLDGSAYVDHGVTADVVVLAHDGALHVVEARDVRAIEQPSIDGARRLARVARPTAISAVCDVRTIERAVDRATLYTAAQLVGLGRRCLDLSVAYARERHQFGRPIGSYQALRHRMADDWTALEFARPLVWRAAWSMSHGSPDATLHASAAKAAASVAARRAASTAMQVHGAMGYTFECDVQLFLKRILALSTAYGNARAHRRRLGEVLRSRAITAVP